MPNAMSLKEEDVDTPEKREKYTVGILGCSLEGLRDACLFADAGFKVICADADHQIIHQIEKGRVSSAGQKLNTLLNERTKNKQLTAERNLRKAISSSDIIVLSGRSELDRMKKPDYSSIVKTCGDVGLSLHPGALLIFASTTGPGVTESLIKETLEKASGLEAGIDFGLAYSPTPTSSTLTLEDATSKRVVGAVNKQSLEATCLVLRAVTQGKIVKVRDIKTAETSKLLERIYENINIALANELAEFCENAGIDLLEAENAANIQHYPHLFDPQLMGGPATREPLLLIDEAEALNTRFRMLTLAERVNEGMVSHTLRLAKDALRACGKTLRRAKIAVFGISSRPNTKDTEGSPVKKLVDTFKRRGGHVRVYDPLFSHRELEEMGYQAESTLTKTVKKADCLVIAVGHDRFRRLNLKRIKRLAKESTAIVDVGRVIDPEKAEKEGFAYRAVGRGV